MADDFSQANRRLRITTPLGDDALLVTAVTGEERISGLFHFDLELIGRESKVDFDQIVGKAVTLSVETTKGKRYTNGFVSRFSQGGTVGDHARFRAEVVPWLWFLTRTADCRIFQHLSVPDIVKQIFTDLGFTDFAFRLQGTFEPRDYCVQYRETDFAFVSRLMEEEGIFYFFEHEDGKHTLVMGNTPNVHQPAPIESKVLLMHETISTDQENVATRWDKTQEVRTGKWSATDYNFETPSLSLMASASSADRSANQKLEVYDYPAGDKKRPPIERIVKLRQGEEDRSVRTYGGESYARGITPGYRIDLEGVGNSDFDGTYVVTQVSHTMHESWGPGVEEEHSYKNAFECIPLAVPFRPECVTPRPEVHGVQTAVVVGPGGEEIFVDKYGRVKVQFHWDREGKKNETSSCWIRVAHGWAGKNWGIIHIPRIGQEVVVAFEEGDIDHPLIVGSVYNAEQMPPYDLPANMTQSGIKTRSSKGGTPANFNEIRFEDKKGSEQVYIHAEKNQDNVVENDETLSVGRDKSDHIYRDKRIVVDRNHDESIGANMTIGVMQNLTETVALNYAETVGVAMELTVGAALAITVGAAMTESVGGNKTEAIGNKKDVTVGKDMVLQVGKNVSETIGDNQSIEIGKDLKETIGGEHQETVAKDYSLKAKRISIVADDEISIKTGSAEMVLKKNGDITISGNKISVKGSGDVVLKGSKIVEN
jgi:type VI secretion system secreted protein VgrG